MLNQLLNFPVIFQICPLRKFSGAQFEHHCVILLITLPETMFPILGNLILTQFNDQWLLSSRVALTSVNMSPFSPFEPLYSALVGGVF